MRQGGVALATCAAGRISGGHSPPVKGNRRECAGELKKQKKGDRDATITNYGQFCDIQGWAADCRQAPERGR